MIRNLALGATLGIATTVSAHAEDLVTLESPHSVDVTLDRLEAAIAGAGATVFARIDHAAGAAKVDSALRPTQLLIFGNPALGTPAMIDAQTAGLDLPLRILAFEDAEGQVHLTYHAPSALASTHGLASDAPYLAKMTGALGKLTAKAVATD